MGVAERVGERAGYLKQNSVNGVDSCLLKGISGSGSVVFFARISMRIESRVLRAGGLRTGPLDRLVSRSRGPRTREAAPKRPLVPETGETPMKQL